MNFLKMIGIVTAGMIAMAWSIPASGNEAMDQYFEKGNAFYQSGDFQSALGEYEKAISEGWESAALHYNIGNCYFKLEDWSRAILSYERALKIAPRDKSAAYNLSLARTRLGLAVGTNEEGLIYRVAGMLSLTEWIWMCALCVFFLGLGVSVSVWFSKFRFLRMYALIVFCAAGIACGYLLVKKSTEDSRWAVVLENTNTRFEPLTDATAHYALIPGTKIYIQDQVGDWAKIRRFDGKAGWVLLNSLGRI